MVVLESVLVGAPYAHCPPTLKLTQKRYLGIHQWLSPIISKEIKTQIVSSLSYSISCLHMYELSVKDPKAHLSFAVKNSFQNL